MYINPNPIDEQLAFLNSVLHSVALHMNEEICHCQASVHWYAEPNYSSGAMHFPLEAFERAQNKSLEDLREDLQEQLEKHGNEKRFRICMLAKISSPLDEKQKHAFRLHNPYIVERTKDGIVCRYGHRQSERAATNRALRKAEKLLQAIE